MVTHIYNQSCPNFWDIFIRFNVNCSTLTDVRTMCAHMNIQWKYPTFSWQVSWISLGILIFNPNLTQKYQIFLWLNVCIVPMSIKMDNNNWKSTIFLTIPHTKFRTIRDLFLAAWAAKELAAHMRNQQSSSYERCCLIS